jgi:D-alanyl-D-alanine carboxypeptidase
VARLRADLTRVFHAPVAARSTWAVDVRSLDRPDVLYQLDAERLVMPASNMKIVTLAAAAELLGWDYRFTTVLESDAPIVDGVLDGDLFVRGTGDPTIAVRNGRASSATTRRSTTSGWARDGRGTTCSTAMQRRSAPSSSTRTSPG